ncbi:Uncharacterized protein SCG7109_AZ_00020 [Chlamydiales bacterium SCGC AG-110-M15]|nr:Uncharacterized protein SCG7109_AZ_00020 [Chlamydiales bacterium SCGC AG-110-M15]
MNTLITMLPLYLLGNLHCMGMCGPLVMMIGTHQHRYWYFIGRLTSFSLAGLLAGEIGSVINLTLKQYHISTATSFIFGTSILIMGLAQLFGWAYPGQKWISQKSGNISKHLSLLILKDQAYSTFLFGFFTVLLPCGQTLIVFSACALTGSAFVGWINGLAFALLTSPSLFLAMRAQGFMQNLKSYYRETLGILALIVGGLSICRGLAEMEIISHWVLNERYHIVIY